MTPLRRTLPFGMWPRPLTAAQIKRRAQAARNTYYNTHRAKKVLDKLVSDSLGSVSSAAHTQ